MLREMRSKRNRTTTGLITHLAIDLDCADRYLSAWHARSAPVTRRPEGRLVVVFANKQPDAWETLVAALIGAGFVVDGSWPIQTERRKWTRGNSGPTNVEIIGYH
jgi:hypothetical protein